MVRFLWICFGGGCGTGVRYLVGLWAAKSLGAFPYGTLIVNVLGCFLIAVIAWIAAVTTHLSETQRLALTTGVMGGLTTYSSFNFETTMLLRDKAIGSALLNIGLTTGLCFGAGMLGLVVARKFVGS